MAKTAKKKTAAAAHPGMGALPHDGGTAFRVWAPHASAVAVSGDFNDWQATANPLAADDDSYWYGDVPEARVGDEYRFVVTTAEGELSRIDPYAREVTHSAGNGVIPDPHFDWDDDSFECPPWNELVIYEMHVGTFYDPKPDVDAPASLDKITKRVKHLKSLGVNALQLMPIAEFAGDRS
jgi:1,4-alpha-glucan branching enzyme